MASSKLAGVIRLRRGSADESTPATDVSRRIAKRGLQHASGAKPFRGVGKNFGAALPANSDYPKHCRSRSRVPRWYSVKFSHTLRLEHGNEMAQLIFDIAGRRNGVGNFLSQ